MAERQVSPDNSVGLEAASLPKPDESSEIGDLTAPSLPRPPIGKRGGLAEKAQILATMVATAVGGAVGLAPKEAEGAVVHPYVPTSEHISFASQFPSVLHVTSDGGLSSGVVIDPKWMVKDAHALVDSSGNLHSNITVGTGSNYLTDPGAITSPTHVFIHPSYNGIGKAGDIALLYFEDGIPGFGAGGIAPAPLLDGPLTRGETVFQVGFGDPGNPVDNLLPETGDKMGTIVFAEDFGIPSLGVPTDYVITRFEPESLGGTRLSGVAAPGDSGGGLFVERDGTTYLAGVMGFNTYGNINPEYGNRTGSILTSEYDQFFDDSFATVPEPSALMITAVGLGGITLLRRRRS